MVGIHARAIAAKVVEFLTLWNFPESLPPHVPVRALPLDHPVAVTVESFLPNPATRRVINGVLSLKRFALMTDSITNRTAFHVAEFAFSRLGDAGF